MTTRLCLLFCLALGLGHAVVVHAQTTDAVVMILANGKDGSTRLGSGFFTSADGRLITCYHLIAGASKIRVVSNTVWTDEVVVQAIAPSRDLAMLRLTRLRARTPFIPLNLDARPQEPTTARLDVYGYTVDVPRGQPSVPVPTSSNGYVTSSFPRHPRTGHALFAARDVALLQLDLAMDSRLVGGPVVVDGSAVAVVLGSLGSDGRTWALPATYSAELTPFNRTPDRIDTWPAQTLVSPSSMRLVRQVPLRAELLAALDRLGRFIENKTVLQDRAMSELTDLGNQAIERSRRAVDLAVFRYGARRRVEDIALDADAEFEKALGNYATRHDYYNAQFDALDAPGVVAALTSELGRVVARRPGSPAPPALEPALSTVVQTFARPDAIDVQRASRVEVFTALATTIDDAELLEDLRRGVEAGARAYRTLLDAMTTTNAASSHLLVAKRVITQLVTTRQ